MLQCLSTARRHDHKHVGPLRPADSQKSPQAGDGSNRVFSSCVFFLRGRKENTTITRECWCKNKKRKTVNSLCLSLQVNLMERLWDNFLFICSFWRCRRNSCLRRKTLISPLCRLYNRCTVHVRNYSDFLQLVLSYDHWLVSLHNLYWLVWFWFSCGLQNGKMTKWRTGLTLWTDTMTNCSQPMFGLQP